MSIEIGVPAKLGTLGGHRHVQDARINEAALLLMGQSVPGVPEICVGTRISGESAADLGYDEYAVAGGWLIWNDGGDFDVINVSKPVGWYPLPGEVAVVTLVDTTSDAVLFADHSDQNPTVVDPDGIVLPSVHEEAVEAASKPTAFPIDTAPTDGRAFMAFVRESDVGPHWFAPVSRDAEGGWWDDSTGDQISPIRGATHWADLPEAPDAD